MKTPLPSEQEVRNLLYHDARRTKVVPEHVAHSRKNILKIRHKRRLVDSLEGLQKQIAESELKRLIRENQQLELDLIESTRNRIISEMVSVDSLKIKLEYKLSGRKKRKIFRFKSNNLYRMQFDRWVALVLKKSFNIHVTSRDRNVRNLLNYFESVSGNETIDHSIIKVDIRDFYESVDHDLILDKIGKHRGVPKYVTLYTQKLLEEYSRQTKSRTGIPRGIPISSTLGEMLLEDVDKISRVPEVALYLRYVDDILVIADRRHAPHIRASIENLLRCQGLEENQDKSRSYLTPDHSADLNESITVDYLGYSVEFLALTGKLQSFDISAAKRDRFFERVKRFERLAKNTCWANADQVRLLVSSLEYGFGVHSTVIDGTGQRIVTGIQYSSKIIEESRLSVAHPNLDSVFRKLGAAMRKMRETCTIGNRRWSCVCCGTPIYSSISVEYQKVEKRLQDQEILRIKPFQPRSKSIQEDVKRVMWI